MEATPAVPTLIVIPPPSDASSVHRRYAHVAPIQFWRTSISGTGQGIRLKDMLEENYWELVNDGLEAMFAPGAKVTYKIEWPGYLPMCRQMHARRVHGVQCRKRIAKQIAQLVDDFVYERARSTTLVPEWRIGEGFIEYERLYLMELRRVSHATWVAVLAYAM